MTDKQILARLKLSDASVRILIHRVSHLKPAQLRALGVARHDFSDAAKAIGGNCTPHDLQRFVSARTLKHPAVAFFFMAGGEDED